MHTRRMNSHLAPGALDNRAPHPYKISVRKQHSMVPPKECRYDCVVAYKKNENKTMADMKPEVMKVEDVLVAIQGHGGKGGGPYFDIPLQLPCGAATPSAYEADE